MSGRDVAGESLERFRQEVLRWNRRINLVSRRDPELRVRELASECLQALQALPGALATVDPDLSAALSGQGTPAGRRRRLVYADIGSGAGFPGIVWWLGLRGARPDAGSDAEGSRCCLFEPRRKRAWFLEHVIRELGLPGASVLPERWGGPSAALAPAGRSAEAIWLVSLKAVRMTEDEVLAGWETAAGRPALLAGEALVVARFHPGSGEAAARAGWPGPVRISAPFGPAGDPTGTLEITVYRG